MRVCLVGGIFGKDAAYRASHQVTPETVLSAALSAAGVEVTETGHNDYRPDRGHFDIVHVHHMGRAALASAALLPRGRRLVFTGHDGTMLSGTERGRLRRTAFAYVARRADALVALSGAERRFLETVARGQVPVFTIPNGIPTTHYRLDGPVAAPAGAAGGAHQLFFVGQLLPLKGIDVLLRAVAQLRQSLPVTLSLAYQTDLLETELRALVNTLGLEGAVHFLGPLPPEDLARRYRGAACVVLPSRAESLPSVLIEALLCGTPVVSTTVGGIPELVGDHGELVAPDDVGGLAQAIRRVLTGPAQRPERRAARSRYATERFGVDRMARDHLACYEAVLGSAAARRVSPVESALVRLALRGYYGRPAGPESAPSPNRISPEPSTP